MMIKNKRRTALLRIIGIILSVWLLLTLIWFAWSRIFFSGYCNEMKPNEFSNIITPRYYKNDEKYTYFVKYPDYLSTTGNLAVSVRNDEAVKAFLPVIAKQVNISEIYGICLAENTAALAVKRKCGIENLFAGSGSDQGAEREIVKNVWREME